MPQDKQFAQIVQNKRYFFIALVVMLLGLAVLLWFFWVENSGNDLGQTPAELSEEELEGEPEENVLPEGVESGNIGEIDVGDLSENGQASAPAVSLPDNISSTSGMVLGTEENILIVQGIGTNFADGQSRELRCVFTEETITLDINRKEYQGKAGLAVLKKDMRVFIDGAENLRGKIEFKANQVIVIY